MLSDVRFIDEEEGTLDKMSINKILLLNRRERHILLQWDNSALSLKLIGQCTGNMGYNGNCFIGFCLLACKLVRDKTMKHSLDLNNETVAFNKSLSIIPSFQY